MSQPSPSPAPGGKRSLPRWLAWVPILAAVGAVGYLLLPSGEGGLRGMDHSPAAIDRGRALFAAHCAVCHGPEAVGQLPESPMGGLTEAGAYIAPALNGSGHAWHHPPAALFEVVKHGSPAEDSPMRGWAGRLEDDEIRAILGYLHQLWPAELQQRYRQHSAR